MIFKNKKNDISKNINSISSTNDNLLSDLLIESKSILQQVKSGNFDIRFNTNNTQTHEILSNLNEILTLFQNSTLEINENYNNLLEKTAIDSEFQEKQIKELQENLIFANKTAKIGLWEMNIVAGDTVNPNNTFMWTEDFRSVLGFSDEKEFPNILGSWGDRIHPDDSERVYSAFGAHMSDLTGTVPFNVKYKIKLKNGEYHWVHSQGNTVKDENGIPVRCIGSIQDIHNEKLKEILDSEITTKIEDFSQSMKEIVDSIRHISTTAQELADYQEDTMKISQEIKLRANETQTITEFIKNISTQTNLLGLNASIEAARSGQAGLGFNVVANQIRNLSTSSSNAVEKIENSINNMNSSIDKIVINIGNINGVTQTQAATTEEVNACVEEINILVEDLVNMVTSI